MTVVAFASGTQTAVIGTEHFISSPNAAGLFRLTIDLSVMQAGDVVEIRVYKMALTGGTSRPISVTTFYGVQPVDAQITISDDIANELTDANAVRFSLKQTFGTGRSFPWVVHNVQDFTFYTAPDNVDIVAIKTQTDKMAFTVANKIDANVYNWNGAAVATPATAGVPDVNAKNIGGQAASLDSNNLLKVSLVDIINTALTEGAVGQIAAAFKKFFDVAASILTTASVNQTGDNYVRLGVPATTSIAGDIAQVEAEANNMAATLGTDGKIILSTDAMDRHTSLHVDAQTLNGAAPNNLSQSQILSDATPFPGADINASISSRAAPGAQMDLVNAPNVTALSAIANAIWTFATRVLTTFGFTVATDKDSEIDAIKVQTDKMQFDGSNNIKADVTAGATVSDADKTDIAQRAWNNAYVPTRQLSPATISVSPAPTAGAGSITVIRGDSASFSIDGLGSLVGRTKLYCTIKGSTSFPDTQAIIQVEETAGLIRMNGEAPAASTDGALIVNDQVAGNITISLIASDSAQLPIGQFNYDIQIERSTGVSVETLAKGAFRVIDDVTRTTV